MGYTTEKPRHPHDCDACHYLGSMYDDRPDIDRWVDLYVCDRTVLARHGLAGEYLSAHWDGALDPRSLFLREARTRAVKAGLIRPCDVEFGADHDHDPVECAITLDAMDNAATDSDPRNW